MFFNSVDIGIDLGTANLLVYIKGKGIVFNEPSVVAINRSKNKILAVGNEARDMIGKVPESISVIRPLKEGVIANYTVTQKMLEFVVERVAGSGTCGRQELFQQAAHYGVHSDRHYFGRKTCRAGSCHAGRRFQNLFNRRTACRGAWRRA